MNPYNQPGPPSAPPDLRPLRRRKRVWAGAAGLLFTGAVFGAAAGEQDSSAQASSTGKPPTATVTATAEATVTERVTVSPEPAPTVTATKTVRTPGPTVTVVRPGGSGGSGSGGASGGGGGAASTCSIKSNSGNCYSPGQYCRNSDHGATTTTASGQRITCLHNGSAWRWTRS